MERILTVAELNEYVRRSLASDPMLRGLRLRGEISNFKRHSAGHLYFSLKDEQARIACVMFRSAAAGLRVALRDGLRVVLSGSAALYPAAGQYQFYVDAVHEDGVGALYLAFEQLKARLQAEGLFDAALKKPLPLLPEGVGIVTSPTGAVVHDICQIAARRHPGVALYLQPARVQGEGAAEEIAAALAALDRRPDVDVIILGRGGGSLEELWPFNEETVARAIFACRTPVVSAVGHETDVTIADFVADVRASTPSAAAELVIPRREEWLAMLRGMKGRMDRAQAQRMALLGHRLTGLRARLELRQPARQIAERRMLLDGLRTRLDARAQSMARERRMRVEALGKRLEALSLRAVLARGYALATLPDGTLLTDAAQARPGDALRLTLRCGAVHARVTEGEHGEKSEDKL
ncbi:MAG TPA: exodeoxyribonuclease VII large subunit [Candidatus Avichristensenella intestinipullorum]|uniref:Exodeoxyribonuclease 7 large subunit n=1 Tax=Candidatus Avichristensenella intestinipullorum TaxID=2840693 RepID=A0A9D0YTU7_9FIRM|nr:exodeoxyribonuclease VII large subunit [Candidatus Avichristensenella intestinipullorum]